MIDWIVRAKISVPPPGPAVTTNSTGRVGSNARADDAITATPAARHAMCKDFFMVYPPS
jgi:hypothetical protein